MIWSHLLNKSLMGIFIFCAVKVQHMGAGTDIDSSQNFDLEFFMKTTTTG